MPRVRIGAAYKFGSTTGIALLQDGNKVALQVFQAQEEGATCAPTNNRQKSQLGSSRFYWEDGN
eukprot:scaffold17010_cov101-Isochrysis_galbana.AAC.1